MAEISIPGVSDKYKTNDYINLLSKLEVLNPVTTLKRGYSVTRIDGKIINNISSVKKGDILITDISNGKIESVVDNIYEQY